MPRPYGLGHGPLTISRAFASVMLVIPRIANLRAAAPDSLASHAASGARMVRSHLFHFTPLIAEESGGLS